MTKPTKWSVRPVKTQVSLVIRPVWSESSLSAWRIIGSFGYPKSAQRRLWSDLADTQTDLSLRRRTTSLLVLSCCNSNQTILQHHNLDPTTHSPVSILILSFMLQQPLHTYARTHTHTHIFSCKFLVSCKILVQMQQTSKPIPLLTLWEQKQNTIKIIYQRIYLHIFLFVPYDQ